jgi:hypothetical protein
MAVAVLVNLLRFISLIPIYYGWWELGRRTTLSPLETAKASGAPTLREVNDNGTVEQIIRQVGKRRIRYGEILVSGQVGEEFLVPWKALGSRLQMADESKAGRPEAECHLSQRENEHRSNGGVYGTRIL